MKSAFSLVSDMKYVVSLVLFLLLSLGGGTGNAQTGSDAKVHLDGIAQLHEIQVSLEEKKKVFRQLSTQLKRADKTQEPELQERLAAVNHEISVLNDTFEQVAIGGVDLAVFGVKEDQFDWREEMVLVIKPLLENLKHLTEKPRKIENLRRIIQEKSDALTTVDDAVQSVQHYLGQEPDKTVRKKLDATLKSWQQRKQDTQREIDLAQFQLDSLEGRDIAWSKVLINGVKDFASGRGLTLLIALFVSIVIWLLMRGFLWLVQRKTHSSAERSRMTRYRLAAYAYKLLTSVFIVVGITVVLYLRRDLLLLAVVIVILIGMALALRNVLPRFIDEGKLLLNIGAVREYERVIYEDIPWQVLSINVYSKLANPELDGTIRLPLTALNGLHSRPAYNEPWFPSSKGDFLLDDSERVYEVLRQSPETVELRTLSGFISYQPTVDFLQSGMQNLSRGESFRVSVIFGIDYEHQSIAVDDVPVVFQQAVQTAINSKNYADQLVRVSVELSAAGESSLDYVIFVVMRPKAAGAYAKIQRLIQQTCVTVCNEQSWGIPFPQLTIHKQDDSTD
ncbi:MAG: hypothetical protein ACRBHB_14805 [Arenicella sp.]